MALRLLVAACLAAALPALAQTQPNAVERFVAAVRAGQDMTAGEYAGVIKPEDAAKLTALAKCIPGPPRTSDSDSAIYVLWDCSDQPGARSAATILDVENGKVTSVFVMPATVVRTTQ